MPPDNHRNKIYVVLVLCIGIVTSVWLSQRKPEGAVLAKQNTNVVSVKSLIDVGENTNDDWKKILVNISPSNQKVVNLTANNATSTFDETTLTAQMSRDFMAQYLAMKKGGKTLTTAEINQIANNVMSSPQYTRDTGPVYVSANLHINTKTDKETIKKYKEVLNLSLKNRSTQVGENPAVIINTAMSQQNDNILKRLDPVIVVGKSMVSDLLNMEIPANAVTMHLALLNAFSNILSNLEDMREISTDPVRAFAGMSKYSQHILELQTALRNVDVYFLQKIGP